MASLLRRKGHANVAYIGQNSEVVPLLLFGAAFAGVPLAPLNYRLDDDHLRSILASLAPASLRSRATWSSGSGASRASS